MNPSHQNVRLQIREQLDFASILYHKGLYKQSLKILDKSKETAIEYEEKNLAYEIVELEKLIESQYITRSGRNRAASLAAQAELLSVQNRITSKLSNVSLNLYDIILKRGYLKNDDLYCIKIASGFYDNHELGIPSSNGVMLLFSQKTGQITGLLLDEGRLTDIRTAAAGAVAAKYLASKKINLHTYV